MIGLSIARRSTRGGSFDEMRERGKLEVLSEGSAKYEAKNDCVAYMAREKILSNCEASWAVPVGGLG